MEKTTLERTIASLTKRFEEANWNSITITMKCNGDKLEITPCTQAPNKTKDTIEYYLVEGPMPWMGADTIEKLAQELIDYKKMLEEHEDEKREVQEYFEAHIKDGNYEPEEWDWYSDWHKDVYGFRPHGITCGA